MIQDSGFRIQDSGFRIQDSGFRIQDSGVKILMYLMRLGNAIITLKVRQRNNSTGLNFA
jgi:hypothetical protein